MHCSFSTIFDKMKLDNVFSNKLIIQKGNSVNFYYTFPGIIMFRNIYFTENLKVNLEDYSF